jgi:hypothetical protein
MVQKRLLLCAAWLAAWIAQPASAEMTDLSAALTAPAFLARGEQINLSLKVHNAGPDDAPVVSVTLELDARLNIASIRISGGESTAPEALGTCLSTSNTLSCQLPQLPSGGTFTFDIVTAATTSTGSFGHIAVVQGNGTDLGLGNNSTSAVTTVSDVSQSIGFRDSGGGGGGNMSLWMLAALLLLSGMRALSVRVQQTQANVSGSRRLLTTLPGEVTRRR